MTKVVFLGPQRHVPTVRDALRSLPEHERGAPVAIVTAGWEERELEHVEFEEHIEGRAVNLEVFRRVEECYLDDPELREATRARHDRMRRLQDLYRLRLASLVETAQKIQEIARDDAELAEPELAELFDSARQLDSHHVARIAEIHTEFVDTVKPSERHRIAQHREEIARVLRECPVMCIAGGHVAILLNRMRLLDVLALHEGRPIVAWSAGAMALTNRVVLFHDSPPQGPGAAEVFESGLGAVSGIVPLPHADHRLKLDDTERARLLARRFAPDPCVPLVDGSRIDWDGTRWIAPAPDGARRIDPASGALTEVTA